MQFVFADCFDCRRSLDELRRVVQLAIPLVFTLAAVVFLNVDLFELYLLFPLVHLCLY